MTNKFRHALGAAAITLTLAVTPVYAADVTLDESGSTLLFPLFQSWIAGYKSVAPDVGLTASATGSTAGTAAAIAGTVRIGTSDAYLSRRGRGTEPVDPRHPARHLRADHQLQSAGPERVQYPARRDSARGDLLRDDYPVERSGDRGAEPRRRAA